MILENKYKIGQEVWYLTTSDKVNQDEVHKIYLSRDRSALIYELRYDKSQPHPDCNLFPDKRLAISHLKNIKVGDVVYYFNDNENKLQKDKIAQIDEEGGVFLVNRKYRFSADLFFKTEEGLIKSLRSY
jgi:hypothetical protein